MRLKAGAQLIARFDSDEDPLAVLALVRKIVMGTLGSEVAVRLEVARGSTAVYIAFLEDDLSISGIVGGLKRQGAQLNFIADPDGQAGFMTLLAEGSVTSHLT